MMKIKKTKVFVKWAQKNKVEDPLLFKAAHEIAVARYEASYGGSVIKKKHRNER